MLFWIHCSDQNSEWNSADINQDKIYKRIKLVETPDGTVLQFERFANEPMDLIENVLLRPRIEVCNRHHLLPRFTPIHIQYVVSMVEGGNDMRGMVMQIMSKTSDGKNTLPVFQFEMRYGDLHARWTSINEVGESVGTAIKSITRPVFNANEWHTLDVYIYLSNKPDGYIRVYRNGKLAWDRRSINNSSWDGSPQLSYGLYCVAGVNLKTQVKSVWWETVSSIPTSNTL